MIQLIHPWHPPCQCGPNQVAYHCTRQGDKISDFDSYACCHQFISGKHVLFDTSWKNIVHHTITLYSTSLIQQTRTNKYPACNQQEKIPYFVPLCLNKLSFHPTNQPFALSSDHPNQGY
ncbi:hypothetical protein EGW08_001458 [Elysia chlorotica]|uniref:Uncharacterized protein n=1 Tax=Elysia chlorotica TaxID=188477 RepID=A0A3S1BKY8_ELYCH|nr:hypothetical protein EGW08_001458 [Elysia chlorotica]